MFKYWRIRMQNKSVSLHLLWAQKYSSSGLRPQTQCPPHPLVVRLEGMFVSESPQHSNDSLWPSHYFISDLTLLPGPWDFSSGEIEQTLLVRDAHRAGSPTSDRHRETPSDSWTLGDRCTRLLPKAPKSVPCAPR